MGQNEQLAEYVFERDRLEFSLGDTLDMKTGLLLAALTFLAIQSSSLMAAPTPLPRTQFALQALSIGFTILGGIFCVIELWPRDYMREATPDEYEAWFASVDSYREQYPDAAAAVPTLPATRLLMAKQRVQSNGVINGGKSTAMFMAFYFTVAAFLANLITMATHLF